MNQLEKIYFYPACKQKLREFAAAGYSSVTKEELLLFCQNYLWKKKQAVTFPQKKQLLLATTPNDFFDYQQIQAQTRQQSSLDDFSDLF
ncbi:MULTISPECIES: post-transcriptional regulator [Enterococcus]|uniref:post-transcriptional regulator n=1 Tax=Enterococcus TaxID=1350 RepID=UPI00065E3146|nr:MULTISPECIES: post-transcriptional regulator [Enterococcus]KAF1300998.1 hypothetical protein BAU16_11510 [Enterococcus sp. JM9B]